MKLVIRAVGKMRDRPMAALCDEYLGRLRRHLPIDVHDVADDAALLGGTRDDTRRHETVALHPIGREMTTAELKQFIERHMTHGTRSLTFLIGGSEGLSKATLAACQHQISLSRLTFPHRLARVILCEQLYRCVSSIRGEPYDK
ncbi:MAG: 23S rRNA (pseudouridine(1915)-N(3))-methyltransferase RlmH [Deltaproteobacteria bacterium]|nr:23S rRNA (pseudouridine(1915)-N(3))-methyltransferase RlmH [Deltaproteobacteria bacterium]